MNHDMNNNSPFSHRSQEPETSVLYLVGTPIGNLDDISYRAIRILQNVSLVACEDTRQTKKIMNKFEIHNNLVSFNKNNSFKKIPSLINDLKKGRSLALVSDAGMPSICDGKSCEICQIEWYRCCLYPWVMCSYNCSSF